MTAVRYASQIIRHIAWRTGLLRFAGERLTVFDDDTFLVSYPKSGNTWFRFLLATLRTGEAKDFVSINQVIPDIYGRSDKELRALPRPRLLKSHASFDARYPRVIWLARDPRDAAISLYYWRLKTGTLGRPMSLEHYLREGFAEREIATTGWGAHTRSWISAAGQMSGRIILVKFKELRHDTHATLRKTAGFLGWTVTEPQIRKAVALNNLKAMRAAERAKLTAVLPAPVLRLMGREPLPFAREGKTGGWKDVFDEELNDLYWRRFGEEMRHLGYPRSPDQTQQPQPTQKPLE